MDTEKNIDTEKIIETIKREDKLEIRRYNLFAIGVVVVFFLMLCFNISHNYFKDIGPALTNFLTLVVGYIPFQQIAKRRKRIKYFDVAKETFSKEQLAEVIRKLLEAGMMG
jgi:glycopeptide antibiotics resistance protein